MPAKDSRETHRCIRCDEDVDDPQPLPFDHEAGALPICSDCFDEVRDRDMWR